MTVKKSKPGRPRLLNEGQPRQYCFKADPDLDEQLVRVQADLEAYDISASKAGIMRFIVSHTIPKAVELIRAHIEEHPDGTAEPPQHRVS